MRIKLIALGNVLMTDDGVAIYVTRQLEKQLSHMGVEVIYGETDASFCVFTVKDEDYLIVLDAASLGKLPAEITAIPLQGCPNLNKGYSQHSYNLLDLLKLYHPEVEGMILAIEISEVGFGYGLSPVMEAKVSYLSEQILNHIKNIVVLQHNYLDCDYPKA